MNEFVAPTYNMDDRIPKRETPKKKSIYPTMLLIFLAVVLILIGIWMTSAIIPTKTQINSTDVFDYLANKYLVASKGNTEFYFDDTKISLDYIIVDKGEGLDAYIRIKDIKDFDTLEILREVIGDDV